MSIKVPAQEHGYTHERRRTAKERDFGKAIAEGFRAQAQERRERQEARGIPTRAPINGKSPAATEFERMQRELAEINARMGEQSPRTTT